MMQNLIISLTNTIASCLCHKPHASLGNGALQVHQEDGNYTVTKLTLP